LVHDSWWIPHLANATPAAAEMPSRRRRTMCSASSAANSRTRPEPCQRRHALDGVLRAQTQSRRWCRRGDMAGLRGGPRAESRGPPWKGPQGNVSAATISPDVHTEADGRQRPLAIAALEDKIVQGACVIVLNAIYEEDLRIPANADGDSDRLRTVIPIDCGQRFRSIADSVPVIADSGSRRRLQGPTRRCRCQAFHANPPCRHHLSSHPLVRSAPFFRPDPHAPRAGAVI
jgi:hypothetical protein